jgi:hypothetical protein
MALLNHPQALAQLRAERTKMPRRNRLETAGIRICGLRINVFDRYGSKLDKRQWIREDPRHPSETWTVGGAPSDVFYDDGELFIDKRELKRPNVLLHELCHYFVADRSKVLDQPNWGLDGYMSVGLDDEPDACRLEFFFGYMSGAYSYKQTLEYIDDYNFSEELHGDEWQDWQGEDPPRGKLKKFFVSFLYECAKVAKTCRLARQLAEELDIPLTKKAIREKVG